jgi:hypothetical protein
MQSVDLLICTILYISLPCRELPFAVCLACLSCPASLRSRDMWRLPRQPSHVGLLSLICSRFSLPGCVHVCERLFMVCSMKGRMQIRMLAPATMLPQKIYAHKDGTVLIHRHLSLRDRQRLAQLLPCLGLVRFLACACSWSSSRCCTGVVHVCYI